MVRMIASHVIKADSQGHHRLNEIYELISYALTMIYLFINN